MRLALSALAAVIVVVAVALLAKSAKAYGAERPSFEIPRASAYVEEPARRPAPRSKNRPAARGPCPPR